MKNIFSKAVIVVLLITSFCSLSMANHSSSRNCTLQISQQNGKVVSAVYVGQGGLSSVLIQVVKSTYGTPSVTAYCSGYDYNGRQVWQQIQMVQAVANKYKPRTSDPRINEALRSYAYTANIGGTTIYFNC